MIDKDKILSIIRMKGPMLPVQLVKEIGGNTMIAGAILSDLVKSRRIKISHAKIGSSPVYYAPGQEARLSILYDSLHEKEKRAYDLLKDKKILRDTDLQPVERVALRELQDFAVKLEVNLPKKTEIFWKWHLIPNNLAESMIKAMLGYVENDNNQNSNNSDQIDNDIDKNIRKNTDKNIQQETKAQNNKENYEKDNKDNYRKNNKENKPINKEATDNFTKIKDTDKDTDLDKKHAPTHEHNLAQEHKAKTSKETKIIGQDDSIIDAATLRKDADESQLKLKDQQTNKLTDKQADKQIKSQSDDFLKKIKKEFKQKGILIKSSEILRKNSDIEMIIDIPTPIGNIEFFCKAKSKKKNNEGDLSSAYIQGQTRRMPVLYVTTGDVTKKALEKINTDFKGMVVMML